MEYVTPCIQASFQTLVTCAFIVSMHPASSAVSWKVGTNGLEKILAPNMWSINVDEKKNQGNRKTVPSAMAHWSSYLTGYRWQTYIIHSFHKFYFWNLGIYEYITLGIIEKRLRVPLIELCGCYCNTFSYNLIFQLLCIAFFGEGVHISNFP